MACLAMICALLAISCWYCLPEQSSTPEWHGSTLIAEPQVSLYRHEQNQVIRLTLEDYVLGVMMAEMPLLFGEEALKAQAVCARSYALRSINEEQQYPLDADLSDDVLSCQAYISLTDYQSRNPQVSAEMVNMARRAVESTRGEVLIDQDHLIDAVYHASCGGRTTSAAEVWGEDYPYLQSVTCDSPECKQYQRQFHWSAVEICTLLDLPASSTIKMKIIERDQSGRARRVRINDQDFSAAEIRRRLNLPSTWIKVVGDGPQLNLQTQGYGHGAGLCQRGAGAMAAEGYDYREILYHYYQGVKLVRLPW